jgi:predicted O-methyltransferase YrrM
MNHILADILARKTVTDGANEYPLNFNMDKAEGELIMAAFRDTRPDVSIEIGCAYGISALFACIGLSANAKPCTHHILDPFQTAHYHGIGLRNLAKAGFDRFVQLHEVGSEIMLPQLLDANTRIQAAIIDGWHTFDHTMIDFFYINKMLDVGGIIILDDIQYPAVAAAARHILTYPAYELYAQSPDPKSWSTRTKVRQTLSTALPMLKREWDQPTCMAFRKIAEDTRPFDWHRGF